MVGSWVWARRHVSSHVLQALQYRYQAKTNSLNCPIVKRSLTLHLIHHSYRTFCCRPPSVGSGVARRGYGCSRQPYCHDRENRGKWNLRAGLHFHVKSTTSVEKTTPMLIYLTLFWTSIKERKRHRMLGGKLTWKRTEEEAWLVHE